MLGLLLLVSVFQANGVGADSGALYLVALDSRGSGGGGGGGGSTAYPMFTYALRVPAFACWQVMRLGMVIREATKFSTRSITTVIFFFFRERM